MTKPVDRPYKKPGVKPVPEIERFRAKVATGAEGECWIWTGHIGPQGYGTFYGLKNGKRATFRAHRWSYEHFVGPIPEGLVLDHLCRVRHCVNPAHLEPVTDRENIIRGISPLSLNHHKTHCKRGHEFTEENTYTPPTGGRICRTCMTMHSRRQRELHGEKWDEIRRQRTGAKKRGPYKRRTTTE